MTYLNTLDTLCHGLFPAGDPGAAVGVIAFDKGGDSLRYARGFGLANLAKKIAFTPQTPFRACSISKQFVCLLVLQLEREGKIDLGAHPSAYLPLLKTFHPATTVRHLCQNRSGLRDYWCTAMLTGARAESRFTLDDGAALIVSLAEPMFAPGTQYSYSNGNWRILEWIINAVTGQTLPDLLTRRLFLPAGMRNTGWACDTSLVLPGNVRGYRRVGETWEEEITRACWSGDAALVTTLDDFLLWEGAMLARTLPCSAQLGEAMPNPDGSVGSYAFGINAWQRDGRWMLWHSGALRGWRMVHLRFPQDRTSIVVMMNRTENPMPHTLKIAACLDLPTTWDPVRAIPAAGEAALPLPHPPGGIYYSENLGLLAEIVADAGETRLNLGAEAVDMLRTGPSTMANSSGFYRLEHRQDSIALHARQFGWRDIFTRVPPGNGCERLAGRRFENALLKSALIFSADGSTVHITGPCGESDTCPVRSLGRDFAAFDCLRAIDETPPGRFTIHVIDEGGRIEVGCFMARRIIFTRAA